MFGHQAIHLGLDLTILPILPRFQLFDAALLYSSKVSRAQSRRTASSITSWSFTLVASKATRTERRFTSGGKLRMCFK